MKKILQPWRKRLQRHTEGSLRADQSQLPPHQLAGIKAEEIALRHLQERGLIKVTQNFNCRLGEIDLIMQDNDTLVFVEVRYRQNAHYGDPMATITPAKQQKIIRAASLYLQKNQLNHRFYCRFDVVSIQYSIKKPKVQWLKHAFSLTS